MADLKEFADRLLGDVVADMADSFFGDRKLLDDKLEAFALMVEEFRPSVDFLKIRVAQMRHLLLDPETAASFFIEIGVAPECVWSDDTPVSPLFDSSPFAFTDKGRYTKCVKDAYSLLQKSVEEYNHGRYYTAPESGRKLLTNHYLRLRDLADFLNGEIERVNNAKTPSGTIRYFKGMDTEQGEREKVMGSGGDNGQSLDDDLSFKPVDFQAMQLPEMQDLPVLKEVEESIDDFCGHLFSQRREEALAAMEQVCGE